jgi:hypothetical protein
VEEEGNGQKQEKVAVMELPWESCHLAPIVELMLSTEKAKEFPLLLGPDRW